MLRMKRVLSSFKKTMRLSTIFHHLETKHENLKHTLEIVLSRALVLKVWTLKPRDSSKLVEDPAIKTYSALKVSVSNWRSLLPKAV